MQEDEGLENLVQETLGLSRWESCALGLHVLFQIVFKILEDEEQLLLTEQYFFKLNNVWVL